MNKNKLVSKQYCLRCHFNQQEAVQHYRSRSQCCICQSCLKGIGLTDTCYHCFTQIGSHNVIKK